MASNTHNSVSSKPGLTGLNPNADNHAIFGSRPKRRRLVESIIRNLETIKEYEDAYLARIPVNLQSAQAYEDAELAIDYLDQAIDLLKDTY